MKIDSLTLHLPPEFAGRERALGKAIADALADIPLAGDQRLGRLSQSVSGLSPSQGNETIARRIATNVHSGLDTALTTARPPVNRERRAT